MDNKMTQGDIYWIERSMEDSKRDWKPMSDDWVEDYWDSARHPHRNVILNALKALEFESLLEVGSNCGPNIARIRKDFRLKDSDLAGVDASVFAINKAKEMLPGVTWKEGLVTNLPFPDKSYDVVLSDAVLMYVGPEEIEKALSEMDRVAKKALVLVEWFDESPLGVVKDYHWARNYTLLLKKLGYKRVDTIKIISTQWPSQNWIKNGYLFVGLRSLPRLKTSGKSSKSARGSKSTRLKTSSKK